MSASSCSGCPLDHRFDVGIAGQRDGPRSGGTWSTRCRPDTRATTARGSSRGWPRRGRRRRTPGSSRRRARRCSGTGRRRAGAAPGRARRATTPAPRRSPDRRRLVSAARRRDVPLRTPARPAMRLVNRLRPVWIGAIAVVSNVAVAVRSNESSATTTLSCWDRSCRWRPRWRSPRPLRRRLVCTVGSGPSPGSSGSSSSGSSVSTADSVEVAAGVVEAGASRASLVRRTRARRAVPGTRTCRRATSPRCAPAGCGGPPPWRRQHPAGRHGDTPATRGRWETCCPPTSVVARRRTRPGRTTAAGASRPPADGRRARRRGPSTCGRPQPATG